MRQKGTTPPPPRSSRPKAAAEPLVESVPPERMVIHDIYRIIEKIGSGGMGDVYLAELAADDPDAGLRKGEKVAVKMINHLNGSREDAEARFMLEAEAAKTIDHDNVIEIFKIGKAGKRIFLVMEYLEGVDLKGHIFEKGRLSWEEARPIIEKVCMALAAAHGKNIIHRDMKPENIFLSRNGQANVKVLDFGFAKFADEDERKLTKGDLKVGTPSYAAPEQIWSESYDHRADIYSFGVVIYEMLSGTVPFKSSAVDERQRIWNVLVKHRDEQAKRPSEVVPGLDIPPEAERALMKALSKEPGDRFQSATEMMEALLGKSVEDSGQGQAAPDTSSPAKIPSKPSSIRLAALKASDFGLTPSEDIPVPKEKPKKAHRPHSSGWLKGTVVGLTIGALGMLAYYNRAKIENFINSMDQEHQIAPREPAPPGQPRQAPATFELRVQSEPQGASVYDITNGARAGPSTYLGSTPLHVYVPNGERTIVLVKRGYAQRRLAVSPSSPEHRINLARPRPRTETTAPAPEDAQPQEEPVEIVEDLQPQ